MDPPTLASLLHNVPVPQGFPRRLRRRGRNLQGRLNLDQHAAGEDTRVDGEQDGGIQDEEPVLMDQRNVHDGEVQAEAADLVAPRTVEGEQEREVHAEAADLMDPNTIALDENLVCSKAIFGPG